MDTMLRGGDHVVGTQGVLLSVTGQEELLQRAMLRLSIPRGSFPLDPLLGSEFFRLGQLTPPARNRAALSYAKEALASLPQVEVRAVDCQQPAPETLALTLSLVLNQQTTQVEVTQSL